MKLFTSFINNSFVTSQKSLNSKLLIPIINPSTGNALPNAQFVSASDHDVMLAIESAHKARNPLCKSGVDKRILWLSQIREQIERDRELLARLECLDNGKTIHEARMDISDVITCFRVFEAYGRELKDLINGKGIQLINPDLKKPDEFFSLEKKYVPVGVVSAILPFNYPLSMISWKLCPSLISGCPIILKPSENTMLTSYMLAKYIKNLEGLPEGSINIVYGDGKSSDAIKQLVSHPKISKVAFTGSVATGKKILEACSYSFKRCSIEAGGKSPLIVFSDYFKNEQDWDKCIDWIMSGIISNKGEICSATSRLIVEKEIYEKLLNHLKDKINTLVVDVTCPDEDGKLLLDETNKVDPSQTSERKSQLGPLVNAIQQKKVLSYIEKARSEGCKELDIKVKIPSTGYFISPTVFYDVTKENTIWREEIFGPVLAVTSFSSEQEAIDLATDSWNGLASSVFTNSEERFERIESELRTGTVWLNASQPNVSFAPWGGFGISGIGRELSEEGIFEFLEVKTIMKNKENICWNNFIKDSSL